jgi:RimJ/RimL family protein N-acetyltransferase
MSRSPLCHTAPTIETPRLILRAHKPTDLPRCVEMLSDPVVLRFLRDKPYSREEVWTRMLRYGGHWQWFGYGFWAIEHKESGQFLGEAGLQNFERDIEVEFCGKPELGYSLVSSAHGKGYAAETAQTIVAWFDRHIGTPLTYCMTSPQNTASQRVALKCGYRFVRESQHRDAPVAMFRRELGATPE